MTANIASAIVDETALTVGAGTAGQDSFTRWEELRRRFQEAVKAAPGKAGGAILVSAAEYVGAVAAVACEHGGDGRLLPVHVFFPAGRRGVVDALLPELMSVARVGCASRRLKRTTSTTASGHEFVSVPVAYSDRSWGVLVFCVPAASRESDQVAMVALYAATWMCLPEATHSSSGVAALTPTASDADTEAVFRICLHAASASGLAASLAVLVNELRAWLRCEMLCLTFPHGGSDARVAAVSRVTTFDRRSTIAAAIEAAVRETLLLDRAQVFPSRENGPAINNLGEVCRQVGSSRAWSWPCKDAAGKTVCVCLAILSDGPLEDDRRLELVTQTAGIIGATVHLLRQGHESLWCRAVREFAAAAATLRRRRNLALALGLIALLLCAPWPFQLPCECVVEPVTRRFVSAPFDGILDRTLVRPGDYVKAGDALALMDGRELNMQLAAKQAFVDQSRQRYTAALAKRDAAASQLAMMEMQQAEQEVGLLDQRRRNLAICSPLEGIVVSGDLHRAEGAPLTAGQKLFEVAPLDRMVVEASVPEHEVGAVEEAQPVSLLLDSHPGVKLRGTVTRLHPQAEIRNQKSIFVAEVEIDTDDIRLLPGMSGQAHIAVGNRAVGWILFHRPWYYLRTKFVW